MKTHSVIWFIIMSGLDHKSNIYLFHLFWTQSHSLHFIRFVQYECTIHRLLDYKRLATLHELRPTDSEDALVGCLPHIDRSNVSSEGRPV